ncbi:MAG: nucleotidyltransferase domain-containing protein [Pseudomonadota bacterium]
MRRIREWAARQPVIRRVWLYGSRARGDNRPDSDIVLAIEVNGETEGSRLATWMAGRHTWRLDIELSHEAHLEFYDPEHGDSERVGPGIRCDGRLLYAM